MTAPGLTAGTLLGPYEIVSLLGTGGMGEVYRARDLRLSREVAVKVLRREVSSDPDRIHRFEQEARAAGGINHPNIVAVYDTGLHDGAPYIVSELLQGETLRDRLGSGDLGVRKSVEYAIQISRGLAAAHEKQIVHRDLKPENLFLTKDGMLKILDFGIAKLSRSDGDAAGCDAVTLSLTEPGTIMGTAGYMSPEQVRGLPTDHRSDLFSLGTVLFEMLTGRRAFRGATPADTMSAVLREDPIEASGDCPELPTELLRVVRRCLEKSPGDRFQTARDLAFALEGATTSSPGSTFERRPVHRGFRGWRATLILATLVGMGLLGVWSFRNLLPSPAPTSFQLLTFRVGDVMGAKFAPDGETIVYSAVWGNNPIELFSTRATTGGERSLAIADALILSVSTREEMAVLLRPQQFTWNGYQGTLARAPMAGGAPREVLEGVVAADWSPDGKDLAVVHIVGDRYRLEYPIGTVLYDPDPPGWISALKISATGDRIAFLEHPVANDKRGGISVVDRRGRKRTLASDLFALDGVGWSPNENEVWFGASSGSGTPNQIQALSLSGRRRVVEETPGGFTTLDVSRIGRVVASHGNAWTEVHARARRTKEEMDLPTTDLSFVSDLSDNGDLILGTDQGRGAGRGFRFFLQKTDGSPPIWLGEGDGQALSPDGRFALAILLHTRPQQLVMVPTGVGEARTLDPGDVVEYKRAVWDPSGRRIVFSGVDRQDVERVYVQDAAAGPPKTVTPEDGGLPRIGRPVSPDGRQVVTLDANGVPTLYSLAGGEPTVVPGLEEVDVPISWTPNGRELYVARYEGNWPRIERVDVQSGRRRPWNGLSRSPPGGLGGQARVLVTPDGESYAYSFTRSMMRSLYLTSPLK